MEISRHRTFLLSAVIAALLPAAAVSQEAKQAAPGSALMYVGPYTRQESKGIYVYRYAGASGELTPIGLAAESKNPSWLLTHFNGRFLYAANESERTVSAFSINAETGQLTLLNQVRSGGSSPCHLVLEKTGKYLMVANYGNGSVASFPVNKDGSLGEVAALIQHSGKSIGSRQRGPHAHAVVLSPDHRFLFVPDLGLDQVFSYALDATNGALTPTAQRFAKVTQGSGPRHMAFHPNGRFAYVNSEMGSLVTAFTYDAENGALTQIQVNSTIPAGFTGENNTAEIGVHPNGRFLYVSNRGHDTIAVFEVNPGTGMLKFVEHTPTQGKIPRSFAIDPTGQFLFVANQETDNIVQYKIDQNTGRLAPTGRAVTVDAPVSLEFLTAK
ncbi:MAG: lactonase family protein [Acidobacteriota bacterium]